MSERYRPQPGSGIANHIAEQLVRGGTPVERCRAIVSNATFVSGYVLPGGTQVDLWLTPSGYMYRLFGPAWVPTSGACDCHCHRCIAGSLHSHTGGAAACKTSDEGGICVDGKMWRSVRNS